MRLYFEEQKHSHVILDIFRRPVYLFLNSSLLTLTSACSTVWNQWCCALRLMNYIPVTPSVQQRSQMRAPQCVPLIMEPNLASYSNSVLALDFQSLYSLPLWLHTTTASPPAWPWELGEVSFFHIDNHFVILPYFLLNLDALSIFCVWDYHSEQDEWAVIQLVQFLCSCVCVCGSLCDWFSIMNR